MPNQWSVKNLVLDINAVQFAGFPMNHYFRMEVPSLQVNWKKVYDVWKKSYGRCWQIGLKGWGHDMEHNLS